MQAFSILLTRKEPVMRRLTLALVALSLPAASLAAQRVGIRPGRGPDRPAEKPPQAPGIHDARLYNRYLLSRFSLESSPMLSYIQATGMLAENIPANYWSFGDATQLSFRATPSVFLTSSFTSTAAGGPFSLASADLGLRVKPWTSPRFSPFAEARMSWAYTSGIGLPSTIVPLSFLYRTMYTDFANGHGRGGVFGLGVDTRLSARFWMTTALSRARYNMEGVNLTTSNRWDYTTNATRLTVGFRYNHGRWFDAPR
jgi:hypothetical protein